MFKKLAIAISIFLILAVSFATVHSMSYKFIVSDGSWAMSTTRQHFVSSCASAPEPATYQCGGRDMRVTLFVSGHSVRYYVAATCDSTDGYIGWDGDYIYLNHADDLKQFNAILGEGGTAATIYYSIGFDRRQ